MTTAGLRLPSPLLKLAFWRVRTLARNGDAARDRRDWRAAIANYEAYLSLRPSRWPIRVQLGHAYKEAGDFLAAEVAYRAAVEAAPADADVHLQLARALALGGKIEEALSAYEKSCELEPEGPAKGELETFQLRGAIQMPMDRYSGGVGTKRYPDWRSLADARAARDQRQWDAAAEKYRTYLSQDDKLGAVWEELAGVLAAADRHSDALEAAQKALNHGSRTVTVLTLRAQALRGLGRLEASAAAWSEVARLTGAAGPTDDFGQPLHRL